MGSTEDGNRNLILSFFFFTKRGKEPCPDVPAVLGFSHGVGTFSKAGYSSCAEGRRRPSGRQFIPLNITYRTELTSLCGKRATKCLCNREEEAVKHVWTTSVLWLWREQVTGINSGFVSCREPNNDFHSFDKREGGIFVCVSVFEDRENLHDDGQHPSRHGETFM